ncbi:esterase E4-like [Planococcus citri]|uniref:esterase E4-like n=1 Tax=Planococcus citri TaxID=170843 RepID=UPI0031F81876
MPETVVVSVKEGKIRGVKRKSEYSGAEFFSFLGVPYGQPPISTLRFKDPVKVKPWKDTYDATKEKLGCAQYSPAIGCQLMGTEDCLFNNIHTRELPTKSSLPKPVIVHIHSGGFFHGTPNENYFGSTEFIMHHDIVYVGMAYRLHVLGFANLGIKECSGNQGIKDIILSLRWIKDNIKSFGGDPENVTLLGSSSGGGVIHALMLSPVTKGLFQKAVIMGSYLFNPTYPFLKDTNEELIFELACSLGYEGNIDDKKKLLTFLKKLHYLQIVEGQRRYLVPEFRKTTAPILPSGVLLPSVDCGENGVLPEFPRNLIQSTARIPLLIGFGEREAAFGFFRGSIRDSTEKNFKTTVRQNKWGWGRDLSDEDTELIYKQVESSYLQGKSIKQTSLSTLVDIQTGILLSDVYDTLIDVVASDPESPVYVYKFEFEGEMETMKNAYVNTLIDERLEGTYHADDHCYWNRVSDPLNVKTKQMVEIFTKIITAFARTGNPNNEDLNVHWKPTKPDSPCYLNINNNLTMVDSRLHNEKLEFWDKIKKQFEKK